MGGDNYFQEMLQQENQLAAVHQQYQENQIHPITGQYQTMELGHNTQVHTSTNGNNHPITLLGLI